MKYSDIQMNLQFFAEDTGNGDGGATGGTQTPAPKQSTDQNAGGDDDSHKDSNTDDTAGEKSKIPEGYHSDEEVNQIINEKFAKWKAKQDEADKMAKMDTDQKTQYELEQTKKKNEELEAYRSKVEMTKTARKMAGEAGVNLNDDDLSHIVTTEADSTTANLDWIKDLKTRISESVKKEYLSGNAPKVSGSSLSGKTSNYGASLAKKTAVNVKNPYFNNSKQK
ncbi:DUF4355 domain-containing protein [Lentilactobacillus buchneri]|uniref:DUF4355 domain-containing protein n=1 Tax=Lentilactobacillus buchneri TaxID=1581 RepID=UPI0021A8D965|nr:DUF4355 domain-containing protein [Lentilactobacillus buchneri]